MQLLLLTLTNVIVFTITEYNGESALWRNNSFFNVLARGTSCHSAMCQEQ